MNKTLQQPVVSDIGKKNKRIESIDLLRGVVIIIMALDHVRDYFFTGTFLYDPANMDQTNAPVFFTRWITHFCAPVFVFLAGTSAFLVGERKSKQELSKFLLTRGLWLMALEITIIAFAWNFDTRFYFFRLQVIWVLGLAMVLLAVIIHLPFKLILVVGFLILFGHNLLDNIHATGNSPTDILWGLFHERKRFSIGSHLISTGYPILPWLGIMLLGYCFGSLYKKGFTEEKRKRYLFTIGGLALLLFGLIRTINQYGDSSPWMPQSSFIMSVCSFLNLTKYPPSLEYTLMTLGPALLLLALFEKPLSAMGSPLVHFGRVPLFFYILHLFIIHSLAVFAVVVSGRPWTDMVFKTNMNNKDAPWLAGYGYSLGMTFLVWIFVVLLLFPLCKWYDGYKANHKEKWWLSYV